LDCAHIGIGKKQHESKKGGMAVLMRRLEFGDGGGVDAREQGVNKTRRDDKT
jgi:hypothetical protein